MLFKSAGLPDLKLLAEADESDVTGDAGMFPEAIRENSAAILIDSEDLARAKQRGRKLITLVGVWREVLDKAVDLVNQTLASRVERGRIERWIAIDAFKAVFGEDGAERCRD